MKTSPAHTDPSAIAIDGGGTRCRIALRKDGADITVECGSANVTTDFEAAISEITKGLDLLSDRAGIARSDLTQIPAYAGLAGVTGSAISERVVNAMPFTHLRVEDDRPSALVGAIGLDDGMVAHCGTGSFLAAQVNGKRRFAGGWGAVLGDPASAQWVGRRGLTLTLDTVDNTREHSPLSQFFLDKFSDAAGIVNFASTARPVDFGALAPAITTHAAKGDALATQIMREAASYIVDTLPLLGWRPGMPLCLTGGIAAHYAPYLPDNMQRCVTPPLGEPLNGALALAQLFSKEVSSEDY